MKKARAGNPNLVFDADSYLGNLELQFLLVDTLRNLDFSSRRTLEDCSIRALGNLQALFFGAP